MATKMTRIARLNLTVIIGKCQSYEKIFFLFSKIFYDDIVIFFNKVVVVFYITCIFSVSYFLPQYKGAMPYTEGEINYHIR